MDQVATMVEVKIFGTFQFHLLSFTIFLCTYLFTPTLKSQPEKYFILNLYIIFLIRPSHFGRFKKEGGMKTPEIHFQLAEENKSRIKIPLNASILSFYIQIRGQLCNFKVSLLTSIKIYFKRKIYRYKLNKVEGSEKKKSKHNGLFFNEENFSS